MAIQTGCSTGDRVASHAGPSPEDTTRIAPFDQPSVPCRGAFHGTPFARTGLGLDPSALGRVASRLNGAEPRVSGTCERRALTLIAVLVVISIIALLIALLLPAIKKIRESTRRVVCAAQQRQIMRCPSWKQFDRYDRVIADPTGNYAGRGGSGNGP